MTLIAEIGIVFMLILATGFIAIEIIGLIDSKKREDEEKRKRMDIDKFVKERDEAFKSLKKDKIIEYMKKYNMPVPQDDKVLFGAVHKARLEITSLSKHEKLESIDWLEANGFREDALGISLDQKRIMIQMEV